jgi:hypothetical protein
MLKIYGRSDFTPASRVNAVPCISITMISRIFSDGRMLIYLFDTILTYSVSRRNAVTYCTTHTLILIRADM